MNELFELAKANQDTYLAAYQAGHEEGYKIGYRAGLKEAQKILDAHFPEGIVGAVLSHE